MNPPSNPNSWIGRFIGDNQRYHLDARLGGGGMGDVFLATDTRIGIQVALKLLKETLVGIDELTKRFEREVTISAALKNLHIVEVSDYGVTSQGNPFYVMEYLRGKTLGKLIREKKCLCVEETVNIISQVCEGLRYAHQGVPLRHSDGNSEYIRVVHRDLKPDNIFIVSTTEGDLVKILDFGIAKVYSDSLEQTNLTKTTTFLGTVRYAAPEQLRGDKEIDGRADIYSLGIIIYQMLSGNDPFGFSTQQRRSNESSWMLAHISAPPLPLRQQPGCKYLSPELEAVVMRCLHKEADHRFVSVEELQQALLNAANALGTNSGENLVEGTIAQVYRQPILASVNKPNVYYPPQVDETDVQSIPNLRSPQKVESESSSKKSRLPIKLALSISIGIGVFGLIVSYYFILPWFALQKIENLSKNGDFIGCIHKAYNFPKNRYYYSKSQKYIQGCVSGAMNKIRDFRDNGYFNECIEEAEKIPQDIPNYSEVENMLRECEGV